MLRRFVDAALQRVFAFQHRRLRGNETENYALAWRHEAKRREVARPRRVVLQAIDVGIQAIEQRVGDRLVAALGHPCALEVATAEMDRHAHVFRLPGEAIVEEARIALGQRVGVLPPRSDVVACVQVAIAGQRRVVELQVSAALLRQLGDLLPVQADEIRQIRFPVGVRLRVEGPRTEEPMHDVGRGDGRLRHPPFYHALQEAIVVGDDALPPAQPLLGVRRGGDAQHPARVAEAERAVAQAEALHRVDESRRPAAPAELAVAYARQAERFLESDDLPDAGILHFAKGGFAGLPGFARPRGLDQPRRTHEAADVLGAEGRFHGPAL
jgi:hypothetical protein